MAARLLRSAGPGLSPRVRGNRTSARAGRQAGGSIPACAGEPPSAAAATWTPRVYPRVCGGTASAAATGLQRRGLSPRVRGNRPFHQVNRNAGRSIPACAGEPHPMASILRMLWVYPRVCGGTRNAAESELESRGLSPRVRGNLRPKSGPIRPTRSIPACAGEPRRAAGTQSKSWVYPRVCGGTGGAAARYGRRQGLSPRVRGNLTLSAPPAASGRSIPACAGEPAGQDNGAGKVAVYPRVCGGTRNAYLFQRIVRGLSPRVRGNQFVPPPAPAGVGSIPACAGEPRPPDRRRAGPGVYPRVCGGTSGAGRQ